MSNYLLGHIPHPLNQWQANGKGRRGQGAVGKRWHTESKEDSRHTEQAISTFQFTQSLNEGFPLFLTIFASNLFQSASAALRFKFKLQNAYHSLTLVLTVLHTFLNTISELNFPIPQKNTLSC